jgi:hypothetical protein
LAQTQTNKRDERDANGKQKQSRAGAGREGFYRSSLCYGVLIALLLFPIYKKRRKRAHHEKKKKKKHTLLSPLSFARTDNVSSLCGYQLLQIIRRRHRHHHPALH